MVMVVTVDIEIDKPKDLVWNAITDIDNCENMISGIKKITILNKPSTGLVGLKWEETREMFGKEATETMWVTDAENNEYYCTRAESHGSVYVTRLSLSDDCSRTLLTMSFSGTSHTISAKILSFIMGPLIRRSVRKALVTDLEDIKVYIEKS